MHDSCQSRDGVVRCGVTLRPIHPDVSCGDGYLFLPRENDVLFALVDGLGHGDSAHHATAAAIRCFESFADLPLETIVRKTHESIRETRGVVAFLGRIRSDPLELQCISIGNIYCRLITPGHEHPLSRPGVIGHNLKKVVGSTIPLAAGDMLVLASDGVSTRFDVSELVADTPDEQANEIINRFGRSHDDASALVIHVGTIAWTHQQPLESKSVTVSSS